MNVEHFEPLGDPSNNILNVSGSGILPHLGFNGGMFFHYVQAPLKLLERDANGEVTRSNLIDNQFKGEVWLSLGLEDVADFSLVVPMVFSQSGTDLGPAGQPGVTPDGFALGDVRLTPKIRFMRNKDFGGFGLAVAIPVSIPSGDETTLNGEGVVKWEPRLVTDYKNRYFSVSANLGYQFRSETTVIRNIVRDDMFRWALGARAGLGLDGLEGLLSVFGSVQLEDDIDPLNPESANSENFNTPTEVLVGINYHLPWLPMMASAGGGAGITDGVGSPEYRIFFSLGYVPDYKDRDDDGVIDREDSCVEEPEDKDGFADSDGCPDTDNDEDGIADADDACPDEAEDEDGFEDADGCPDTDNDGDGIADADDACPDEAEDKDGFEDEDGCIDDNDGDGLADADDQCPNEAEDKDGFQDDDGCPDNDNDGDGIEDAKDLCRDDAEDIDNFNDTDGCPDFDNDIDGFCDPWVATSGLKVTICQGTDKCPDEKEIINGVEDDDGCPDEGDSKIKITDKSIVILEKVFFDTGKSSIQKKSFPVLDQVSAALRTNPQITKIQIEGHTDNSGDADKNLKLSQERAEAVTKYLADKGVGANRLIAVGFGQQKPIDSNDTKKGKANNRRVEFNIIEIDGKPVGK